MILFLDGLAVFIVLVLSVIGFQRGFVEELGRLVGLVAASLIGMRFYLSLGSLILARIHWDAQVVLALSFFILFIVALVIFRLLTRMVQIMILARRTRLVDRLLGFIFGFGKGSFMLVLIVWIVSLFPQKTWAQTLRSQSHLYGELDSGRLFIVRLFQLEDNYEQSGRILRQYVEQDSTKQETDLIETQESIE